MSAESPPSLDELKARCLSAATALDAALTELQQHHPAPLGLVWGISAANTVSLFPALAPEPEEDTAS